MSAPRPEGVEPQYDLITFDLPTWTQEPSEPTGRTFVADVRDLMSPWGKR